MGTVTITASLQPLSSDAVSFLASTAGGPSGLDKALRDAGINPMLVNPFLATILDVEEAAIGSVVSMPVHIGPGGRKSLYELNVGEKALAYLWISTEKGVLFKYVERLTGAGAVSTGDTFKIEIRSRDGTEIFSDIFELTVDDPTKGIGTLTSANVARKSVWVLWSCIDVERQK